MTTFYWQFSQIKNTVGYEDLTVGTTIDNPTTIKWLLFDKNMCISFKLKVF